MRLPFFVYRAGRARGIENDVRIMFKNGGVACGRNDIFLGTVFVQFSAWFITLSVVGLSGEFYHF